MKERIVKRCRAAQTSFEVSFCQFDELECFVTELAVFLVLLLLLLLLLAVGDEWRGGGVAGEPGAGV